MDSLITHQKIGDLVAFCSAGLLESLQNAGAWSKRSTYRTDWEVCPGSGCCCSYAYGSSRGVEPYAGERCWPLLAGIGRAVAPYLAPWCAEREVPTAANLNLSHVAWHSDSEELLSSR